MKDLFKMIGLILSMRTIFSLFLTTVYHVLCVQFTTYAMYVLGSSICSMSSHFPVCKESVPALVNPLLCLSCLICTSKLFFPVKMSYQLPPLGILQPSLLFAWALAQIQSVNAELLSVDA